MGQNFTLDKNSFKCKNEITISVIMPAQCGPCLRDIERAFKTKCISRAHIYIHIYIYTKTKF